MDLFALLDTSGTLAPLLAAEEGAGGGGLTINLFWVLVTAANFIMFAALAWYFGFRGLTAALEARRARIEQGLKDADAARLERERAADEKQALLTEARRQANEIVARAQKLADESREREVAETRAEIERLREQAAADIQAEKQRALAEIRGEVADLALRAAGKVVGETMDQPRERRLVEEFLTEVGSDGRSRG
ncbi:MAG TPA: F0F1 ATP synthase subunit B [Candidatus Limnocylindrales bacterium]|nr:F0F1 ATP synthase subunit B [Candidatus Limnocylindrales bacterium]